MNKRNKIAYSKYTINLNSTFETALRSITSFDVHKITITNFEGKTGFGEVVVTPTITGVTTAELVSDIRKSLIPLLSEADLCDSDEFYSILKKNFQRILLFVLWGTLHYIHCFKSILVLRYPLM